MIGKMSASAPTAFGMMLQNSVYGQTIPTIIGTTRSPNFPTWSANLRGGSPNKKLMQVMGQSTGKKGKKAPDYNINVTMLLGHNPILTPLQSWVNQYKVPLTFAEYSVSFNSTLAGAQIVIPNTLSNFYSVVAVTLDYPFTLTVDDYGSGGSVTYTGTYELPLWNTFYNGPDPNYTRAVKVWPFIYDWTPAMGTTIFFPAWWGINTSGLGDFHVYYTQKSSKTANLDPASLMRFTFEPTLGDGPEYTGAYSSQRILYPWYAGLGSDNYDVGPGATFPVTNFEVQGAYAKYSQGDADFADMIEHVVRSGTLQADLGSAYNLSPLQSGAGCYDMPGLVQSQYGASNPIFLAHLQFRMPNVANNYLLCIQAGDTSGGGTAITDTAGNSWTVFDNGSRPFPSFEWCYGYAQAIAAAAGNIVSNNNGNRDCGMVIAELAGVDTVDSVFTTDFTVGSTPQLIPFTYTPAVAQGYPEVLFAITVGSPGEIDVLDPLWQQISPPGGQTFGLVVQKRTVYGPTLVTLRNVWHNADFHLCIIGFYATQPATYPKALGNILDLPSLDLCRTQAQAFSLIGSISMQQQKSCADWMKDFYSSMNSWPLWSGFTLKSIPMSEMSYAANGAIYTSPTSAGPVAPLSDLNGDFVGDASSPPVTVSRIAQSSSPNIIQYSNPNRSSDYNLVVTAQPEAAGVAQYGVVKAAPTQHNEIQDVNVARALIAVAVRRQNTVRNQYKFTLKPKWKLLEAGDLVTITESQMGIFNVPVRLTSTEEDDKYQLACTAERFFYGLNAPLALTGAGSVPNNTDIYADPGSVNTPIIFEPVPRMYGSGTQGELWIVVSGASANYGGCAVLLSTDGGSSYPVQLGTLIGSAITGVTTADWPAHADPDTTNDLPVDLTESLGLLSSYSTADRDQFTYPCYIANGSAQIPYGLLTYNTATLTAANKYTLKATGGGNELRRCVYGAPNLSPDLDHASGSRFAFLGNPAMPSPTGILKVPMDPTWIGKTLFFKFLAFNTLESAQQAQSAATAYSYAPTGLPGGGISQNQQNYSIAPTSPITQTNATTLAIAQCVATFGTNKVNYNARTATITDPGGTPTWYYLTMTDPSYAGDVGSGTTLTLNVELTQAKVGLPGYTYLGAIQAIHSGFGSAIVLPGGYPPANVAIVGS